jgi:hypothetical protein
MEAIYNNSLRIISSIRELLDFLSSAVNTRFITDQLDSIEKTKMPTDEPIKMYVTLFKMINELNQLINTIEDIKLNHDTHSDTFIMSYKKLFNKTKAKYLAFYKDTEILKVSISTEIADKIFAEILAATDKLKILEDLRSKYYKSKELIHIYAMVLQKAIDKLYYTDKQLVSELTNWIEEDKNHALAGYYKTDIKTNKANNPPQTRFGLLPVTNSMPLKELLQVVLSEEKIVVDTDDLVKISKKLKVVGFIVLNSILYTPVEYNIRPLVVAYDAKNYIQPKEYGVNLKTIERFNTLKPLGNINKWDFSIKVYNEDAEKFYILETLDGKNYRALAPWLSSNRYSINKFRVQKLLNYDSKKPSKALEYHARCIEEATKNMFLSKALELEAFQRQLTDVESNTIQANILSNVIDAVDSIIKKEYKNKITSLIDVSDILHHPNIGRTFINSVVKEFISDKSKLDAGKFPVSEILASFSSALQTTSRRFVREVHNGYSRDPLKASELDQAIEKIYKVLQNAIELVIRFDDNLFTSNYYKYLILNYT